MSIAATPGAANPRHLALVQAADPPVDATVDPPVNPAGEPVLDDDAFAEVGATRTRLLALSELDQESLVPMH